MKRYVIPSRDWTKEMVDAIKAAKDGDVLVVQSEAKRVLCERAIGRMRPGVAITVEVKRDD